MAFNALKPATTDNYLTEFTQNIRANMLALALWMDTTHSSFTGDVPDYTKRYNRTTGTIEECVSSTWNRATLVSTSVQAATVSNGTADLVQGTMADNDFFRIRIGSVGGTSNAGYVEFATADDGTEPIVFRQYTSSFTTVAKELYLLDLNGNTSFPGIPYPKTNITQDIGSTANRWKIIYVTSVNSTGSLIGTDLISKAADGEGGQLTLNSTTNTFGPANGGAQVDVDGTDKMRILNFANTEIGFYCNNTKYLVLEAGGKLRPAVTGKDLGSLTLPWQTIYGVDVVANTGVFATSLTTDALVGVDSITLPANAGSNYFAAGTGDGASYTVYNSLLHLHYGLAFSSYDGTINCYYNARTGTFDVKGGYKINGVDATSVGSNQTWQDLTASRSAATNYTNTTGRVIAVSAISTTTDGYIELLVSGITIAQSGNIGGSLANDNNTVFGIVPNGATYRVNVSGAMTRWLELR